MIAKLDRLARNVHFISGLMEAGVPTPRLERGNGDATGSPCCRGMNDHRLLGVDGCGAGDLQPAAPFALPQDRGGGPNRPAYDFRWIREVVLFLVVGGSSAVFYMVLGVVFTTIFGMRPSVAIVVTLLLLMPPTYLTQRNLTFRSDRRHASAFPRYIGTQIIGNCLAVLAAELFPATIRTHPWPAFLAVAVGVAATNWLLLKLWTFRHL